MKTTPEMVEELRRCEKAASAAPWEKAEWPDEYDGCVSVSVILHDPAQRMRRQVIEGFMSGTDHAEMLSIWRANAALIAAARNALPSLLDDHEALTTENARLRAIVAEMTVLPAMAQPEGE